MKNSLLVILFIGLVVRLVLIPLTLHPDFRAVNLAGYLIAQKGQLFKFYDYLSQQPRTDRWAQLYGDGLFIYPPPAYITHAVFNKALFWAYPHDAFFMLLNDIGSLRQTVGFVPLMYFLKLPYLLADIICLYLISRLLPQKNKLTGQIFWIFNPVTIYTSYMMGQFDIFIALAILVSLWCTPKNSLLSCVALGIGAGFKPFILILAPFLPGNIYKNVGLSLGAFIITILPYLGSPAFRQYALFATQTDKVLYARIMISGSQYLPLFVLGLILLFWWRFYKKDTLPVWGWFTLPLLIFYAFTHYHPQWFSWIIPLLTLSFAQKKETRIPILALLFFHFGIVLFFEPSLNFGLFGGDFSSVQFIARYYEPDLILSVLRSMLAASAAVIGYQITRSRSPGIS